MNMGLRVCDTENNGFVITSEEYEAMAEDIDFLSYMCHGSAKAAGWWDNPREVGTMLMLAVSEIAEAMEGHRKNQMDDKLPHRPMIEVEIADCIIRLLDICRGLGLDVGGALAEKFCYNQTREDHKLENRMKEGGKAY